MARAAAFFDLDRTLVPGASGPAIARALRDHGLLGAEPLPGERAAFALFEALGETLPTILATRLGVRAARGWPVETVARAAEDVADELLGMVEPFAVEVLAEHRRAGRQLVLATTSPHVLVAPFAELIGFDDVIATRYRVRDGRYDGTIDGEFVWSQGKARSVSVWALANCIELADSYAYSDSVYDVPLLSRVGYPVAVNPDPRLLVYASVRGWPRRWFDAPDGVPKPLGVEPQAVLARLVRPELLPWLDISVRGRPNLAGRGGQLLAANHRSYLDPLLIAHAAAGVERSVRFLAKKEVTDAPVVGPIATALGAIRVDRGSGDGTPMREAALALRAGELVAVFPQGTIPRGHDFFEPELVGRGGAVQLAIETGVPIVPIGLWGTERAWPRSSKVPYVLNLASPPAVSVTIGRPYRPSTDDVAEATTELMARIVELLPAEARQRSTPSAEELARTFPP